MIDGNEFILLVKKYFNFLNSEFDYEISKEIIWGFGFYDLQFQNKLKIISISYENTTNYFQVIIYSLNDGTVSKVEDETNTIHLNKVNFKLSISSDNQELMLNNNFFAKYSYNNEFERNLLKSAKKLRLFLIYNKTL